MTRRSKKLDRLPLIEEETGDYSVVLETPKGSRNKYKYVPAFEAIKLSATPGEGLAFPYDFGFFPSTLGEDGDPLDVLLFLDTAGPPRNDRFSAVATHAHSHRALGKLGDRHPHLLLEIESFFTHYAGLEGKKLLKAGTRAFKARR